MTGQLKTYETLLAVKVMGQEGPGAGSRGRAGGWIHDSSRRLIKNYFMEPIQAESLPLSSISIIQEGRS